MNTGSAGKRALAALSLFGVLAMSMPTPARAIATPYLLGAKATIGPVATEILKCKASRDQIKDIGKGVLSFFSGLGGGSDDTVTGDLPKDGATSLPGTSAADPTGGLLGDAAGALSVPVSNSSIEKSTEKAAKNTEATAASTNTQTKKSCWQTVQKAAAQVILKQITISTVNWINSGFKGQPAYIQDPGMFLDQIRKRTIGDFTTRIAFDPNYPFGKMVANEIISSTKNSFEAMSRYSLNKVIAQREPGMTYVDFQSDFSVGGWDAFDAQFQIQNNPIGYSLAAQDEISRRVADTRYSPAQDIKDQIQRSGGFLDWRYCVDPNDESLSFPDSRCRAWETATPGSVAAEKLNQVLGSPIDKLTLGDDITTDIGAIIDALLNQGVKWSLKGIDTGKTQNDNRTQEPLKEFTWP